MSDQWKELIPASLLSKYEIHNFHHAFEIMSKAYADEYAEIVSALEMFSLSVSDIVSGGGNESPIPKKLSSFLHPGNWQEVKTYIRVREEK